MDIVHGNVILAVLTFFGLVHSSSPDAGVSPSWLLTGTVRQIPYQFALSYLVLAALTFVLSYTRGGKEPPPLEAGWPLDNTAR